jgi:Hexameric tyrosine-coordinated heme protein (HTHP)
MTDPNLIPGNSLLTKTPDEGRQLAIAISRRIVKATQPDAAVRERLREVYAGDAAMLLQVCQIVATEFATIAAANGYWRESQR